MTREDPKFKLADKQRKMALRCAIKMINEFAIPAFPPELFDKWGDVSKWLLETYTRKNDNNRD